ncbi:MAG TPA: DUF885 domain-containing protein [Verrucomicrobiae bacterium]
MNAPFAAPRSIAALCLAASLSAASGQNMDAKLETFFKQYLERQFHNQPVSATQLGDHRFDHLMDDVSPAARKVWAELDRTTLEDLPRQIEYGRLSRAAQIDYEILEQDLKRSLWLVENTHPFEDDPRVYNGYISDSIFVALAQSTLPRETNVANCLARMEHIPEVVAAAKQSLAKPPRVFVETAIRQNQGAIAFYEKDLFELVGRTSQRRELEAGAQRVVTCLKQYQSFLENDLLPRANGEWRLGRDRFYRKLELVLDAGLTADQVLADAQAEFDRVQRDMYVIARQLWSRYFPKTALPPDDAAGRRATIQQVLEYIARDHSTPAKLVADTRQTVAKLKRFIAEHDILRLPVPDTCRIIEMPEFQRGNATAYMNSPPPLDPNANGYFAVSPPPKDWDSKKVNSFLEEYNRSMLQVLTIHEAYPGHYVQHAYANRNPSLIGHVLGSGVYVEGWAVYTEQTMLDQGYGEGDLALRLSQLKFYLRAVVNAILDHQMHCSAMSDEEAMKLLVEQAYQSEGEARLKVIRAKQSSVQLSTYFVGRMAHYRLRQAVERELGSDFNLGRYHEAVLAPGPVPVKYLPELVRERLRQPR